MNELVTSLSASLDTNFLIVADISAMINKLFTILFYRDCLKLASHYRRQRRTILKILEKCCGPEW